MICLQTLLERCIDACCLTSPCDCLFTFLSRGSSPLARLLGHCRRPLSKVPAYIATRIPPFRMTSLWHRRSLSVIERPLWLLITSVHRDKRQQRYQLSFSNLSLCLLLYPQIASSNLGDDT